VHEYYVCIMMHMNLCICENIRACTMVHTYIYSCVCVCVCVCKYTRKHAQEREHSTRETVAFCRKLLLSVFLRKTNLLWLVPLRSAYEIVKPTIYKLLQVIDACICAAFFHDLAAISPAKAETSKGTRRCSWISALDDALGGCLSQRGDGGLLLDMWGLASCQNTEESILAEHTLLLL
jgi:hypothetical protein